MLLTANIIFDYLNLQNREVYILQNSDCGFTGVRRYFPGGTVRDSYLYVCSHEHLADVPANSALIAAASPDEVLSSDIFPHLNVVLACQCEADHLLDELQNCFDYYEDWNSRLHECLLNGGSPQDLCDLSVPIFRNPIILDDISFRTMAVSYRDNDIMPNDYETEYIFSNGYHSPEYISLVTESPIFLSTLSSKRGAFIHHYHFLLHQSIYSCIRKNGKAIGFLTIVGHDSSLLTPGMVNLADYFSGIVIAAFNSPRGINPRSRDIAEKAVLDAIHGSNVDPAVLQVYLTKLGLVMENPHYIALVRSRPKAGSSDIFVMARAEDLLQSQLSKSKILVDSDCLAVLADNTELSRGDFIAILGEFIERNDFTVGFSLTFYGFTHPEFHYRQALACTKYARLLTPPVSICRYEQIMGFDILDRLTSATERTALCHPAIEQLRKYDDAKGTDLLHTLKMLVYGDFDNIKIAEHMHLHKNTLYYRMRQISDLTGADFEKTSTRDHLKFSMYLHDLSAQPDEP